MEYTAFEAQKYYADCAKLIMPMGYTLIELRLNQCPVQVQVKAVISRPPSGFSIGIGVNDCAKVHRILLPHFEDLLQSQDIYMEVTSPGMERNIKNAAEFALFTGRRVKIWDKGLSDWVHGIIKSSDSISLVLEAEKMGGIQTIAYADIAKAKLLYTEG